MERKYYPLRKVDHGVLLQQASQLAIILIALILVIWALDYSQVIAAPIMLGIVIGLMLSPAVRFFERFGLSSWLAAAVVVLVLLGLIAAIVIGFSVPVSAWIEKMPQIWASLQLKISDWRAALSSLTEIRDKLSEVAGQASHMKVTVDNNAGMGTVITLAPAYLAEVLLFLVSLYFFLATRENFRGAVLSLCVTRRLRWRAARVFRDAEKLMSHYLFSITLINAGLGVCVTVALFFAGTPSPMLWGMLAFVLNFVVYAGPALMVAVLLSIGLAANGGIVATIMPPAIYLALHVMESQLVTPRVLGASMTINPFVIFLSLIFWLWLWGPIGGFIAVPSLLIGSALYRNIIPALVQTAPTYSRIS